MNRTSILNNTALSILLSIVAQPAFAVSDEEFQTLQFQLNQLADQVEQNSKTNTSSTSIGGYGELHYNNISNGNGNGSKKMLDLHRFVIFLNHEYTDSIRFFSEFEIEHAFIKDTADGSSAGEVEVEQAYVQFDLDDHTQVNAGVFLMPVGILNETHEPPTFYGVERNPVEKNIIPTTWWEGGVMVSGHYNSGFSYDLALSSGLNGGNNIRSGRQKTAEATANSLAATGRVKYTGTRGLELAATLHYQGDMTQDTTDTINSATLIETHAIYTISDFTLTALVAQWNIDGNGASSTEKDRQDGAYLEASYKITPAWGIFARQNQWDNGGAGDTAKSQTDLGFNYWPHEDVVIKADYQAQNQAAGDFDGFNLGIGYQF